MKDLESTSRTKTIIMCRITKGHISYPGTLYNSVTGLESWPSSSISHPPNPFCAAGSYKHIFCINASLCLHHQWGISFLMHCHDLHKTTIQYARITNSNDSVFELLCWILSWYGGAMLFSCHAVKQTQMIYKSKENAAL